MFIVSNGLKACCTAGLFMSVCGSLQADLVDTFQVGEGSAMAQVQFDFLSGNSYLYEVRWDGSNLTGRDVFDLIGAAQPDEFEFTYIAYSFGDFLTSVTIGDDYDFGDGSQAPDFNNYWHYWNRSGGDPWESSMVGFSDRVLENGSSDAWVFGVSDAPQTIPAPATIAVVGAVFASRRRRRG